MAGRFDEDTYARARKWREQQEAKSAEKPAAKTPSKVRVSNPVPKKDMERSQDKRHMQDTISTAERNSTKPGTGSGRGGIGGPTADELAAYDKQRRAKRLTAPVTDEEMNRVTGIGLGALGAAGAAKGLPSALMRSRGAAAARTAPSAKPATVTTQPANAPGKNADVHRSEIPPGILKNVGKPAPKPKRRSPRKPDVAMAPARRVKSESARDNTRFNREERDVEFRRGGKVSKRGYGAAKKG